MQNRVRCAAAKPRVNAEKLRLFIKALYSLVFTNFVLFFVFMFSYSFLGPDLHHLTKSHDFNVVL
jgi:hypothetical protein